jgi:cytochrome c oxidase subunit 4
MSHPSHPLETEPPHQQSARPLVITLVALLALTAISWGLSHFSFGVLGTTVALAIAAIKAGFVAYAFMELPLASTVARVVVLVTLSFIVILCAGALGDVGLR